MVVVAVGPCIRKCERGEGLGAKILKPSYYSSVSGVPSGTTWGRWSNEVGEDKVVVVVVVRPRPLVVLPRPSSCSQAVMRAPSCRLCPPALTRAPTAAAAIAVAHTCALSPACPLGRRCSPCVRLSSSVWGTLL